MPWRLLPALGHALPGLRCLLAERDARMAAVSIGVVLFGARVL